MSRVSDRGEHARAERAAARRAARGAHAARVDVARRQGAALHGARAFPHGRQEGDAHVGAEGRHRVSTCLSNYERAEVAFLSEKIHSTKRT